MGETGAAPGLSAVYVARHGQTLSNLRRRYSGSSPEPLTAAGRDQAALLADRLGEIGIAELWSSEIARAAETARIVGERLGVPVLPDPRLNEMVMGSWEGRTEDEIASADGEAYRTWLLEPDRLVLPGRETLAQVASRVFPAIEDAAAAGHRVLLVSHVAPIRVAVLVVLGIPLSSYKRLAVRNGECLRLDIRSALAERLDGPRPVSLRNELTGARTA